MMKLASMIFTGGQVGFLVVLAVLALAVIGVNIWFGFMWQLKSERAMHNEGLRNRREALLDKIKYLNSGGEAAPQAWIDFAAFGSEDDEQEEIAATENNYEPTAGVQPPNTVELAVSEMDNRARQKIGLKSKVFDDKRYYVRYALGFEAKLRFSDDETKAYYTSIMDEINAFDVTEERDFNGIKVYSAGELLAKINFAGKRLAVAIALDPKKYEGGKFDIEDKSDKKSFAKTPLLVRVKNEESAADVRQLFALAASEKSLVRGEAKQNKYDLTEKSRDELIALGAVHVVLMGEAS